MDQRISFITLAVRDVAAARAFYVDGLGWTPAYADDDVVMVQAGEHLVLSLWSEAGFEQEVGPIARGEGGAPFTLSHNVPTREEVQPVLDEARAAGATQVDTPVSREWGGFSGYFSDPDGVRWEVCFNPGEIGQVVLP